MIIKKIFFIADAKSIHTVKWVDYFVEKNYEVYLATFASVNNTNCKNIYFLGKKKTHTLGGNYHYLLEVLTLAKIFKEIKPDFINAHYSYSMGLITLIAKKISQVKSELSVVCHGSDLLAPPKPYIFDLLNRYILNQTDKIFVVSDQLKDKLISLNINVKNIFVGQYGIDIPTQSISKDIDILSNRAYNDNSRIDFLLERIESINHQNLNILFVLPNIKDNDYQRLKSKYSYIKFYKHVPSKEMINLLSRTKIYISATKSDGTSLSLLESLKLKCIPLVSNIISNRSWIVDGVNGYLFNDKKDFSIKLEKVLKSNSFDDMISINEKLVEKKGSYKVQMNKIEKFMMESL